MKYDFGYYDENGDGKFWVSVGKTEWSTDAQAERHVKWLFENDESLNTRLVIKDGSDVKLNGLFIRRGGVEWHCAQ